jgi:hypothetical protein
MRGTDPLFAVVFLPELKIYAPALPQKSFFRFLRGIDFPHKNVWRRDDYVCVALVHRQRNSENVEMQHRREYMRPRDRSSFHTPPTFRYLHTPLNFSVLPFRPISASVAIEATNGRGVDFVGWACVASGK